MNSTEKKLVANVAAVCRSLHEAHESARRIAESFNAQEDGSLLEPVMKLADADAALLQRVASVLQKNPSALKTLARAIDRYYEDAARAGKPARAGITVYLTMS